MTNEEIKYALKSKCKIKWNSFIYAYAQAAKYQIDIHGNFITSLELVATNRCLLTARADECEIVKE